VSERIPADRAGVVHQHFTSIQGVPSDAAIIAMRQVLAATDITSATTPAAVVEAMLASVAQYDGIDPVPLLFTETYLAASRTSDCARRSPHS
jgi:hypothetical protein